MPHEHPLGAELRKRGINMRAFAKLAVVDRGTLSGIINSTRKGKIQREIATRIATALGMRVSDLFTTDTLTDNGRPGGKGPKLAVVRDEPLRANETLCSRCFTIGPSGKFCTGCDRPLNEEDPR